MIESGTLTPGITGDMFGLPPLTALRIERADPALRPFVPAYLLMDSDVSRPSSTEWVLPSWAQIWVSLDAGPVRLAIGNRRYDPIGPAVLFGVSSRAMPVNATGGLTIGIEISPLGWARFVRHSAEELRDRMTPITEALAPSLARDLAAALSGFDSVVDVPGALDEVFLRHLGTSGPDDVAIDAISALLERDGHQGLEDAAAEVGISVGTLRRLAKRYFGFPPRLLLNRARFLRTLFADLGGARESRSPYYDAAHYIRDGQRFLGMTPRRFLALASPYLHAVLRARLLVLGSMWPVGSRTSTSSDGRDPIAEEPVSGRESQRMSVRIGAQDQS